MATGGSVWGDSVWGDFPWGEGPAAETPSGVGRKYSQKTLPPDAKEPRPYKPPPSRAESIAQQRAFKAAQQRGGVSRLPPYIRSPLSRIQPLAQQRPSRDPTY
ncbi:hypothetical protein LCGC14_2792770 [marine sediment metagenome]|uniref:Uncharacterized protein n=1 Tax=marine sediment metagenome TaxID=412755 RepID=A0A0F8YQ05_9ZZZZ